MTEISVSEWLDIRKKAALEIDPETAEVEWIAAKQPRLKIFSDWCRR